MALLFPGTLIWRLPATTSTCRGGSAARSVAAEKGTAGAAGAGDLAGLRSRAGAAGLVVLTAAAFLFLWLIRVTALLDLAARWKPEIPILQNHAHQRHQQNPQRDEHSFPLHVRIVGRGWQGKRLDAVLGLEFVVKHRYGSAFDAGRGALSQYASKPASSQANPGVVERPAIARVETGLAPSPVASQVLAMRAGDAASRVSTETHAAQETFASSLSRMPVAASRISLSHLRLEAMASASGMETILFPRSAAICPNSPRCTMSMAPSP